MNPTQAEPIIPPETSVGRAIASTLTRPSLWINVVVVILPSVAFLIANAVGDLCTGIVAAAIAGAAGVAFRLIRHEKLRGVLIGVALVAACASVAALTGEARGFFLVPTLIPFAVIALCLGTVLARRPLTGLLLNRMSGGPAGWWRDRPIARVHYVATGVAILINVVNATLQLLLYSQNDTVVLTIAHAATGPIFACLVAATIVAERRVLARRRAALEVKR